MLIDGKYRCERCMAELENVTSVCSYCGDLEPITGKYYLPIGTTLKNRYIVGSPFVYYNNDLKYIAWDVENEESVIITEAGMDEDLWTRDVSISFEIHSENEDKFNKYKKDRINESKILLAYRDEPGLVSIYDYFEENNTVYTVKKYLVGVELKQYLRDGMVIKTLSIDETCNLLENTMKALIRMHNDGHFHGSIKLDSILVNEDGTSMVMGNDWISNEFKIGGICLNTGYSPLEIYRHKGILGPWTDVYSLCAVIYRCVSGKNPVDAIERLAGEKFEMNDFEAKCGPYINSVISKGLELEIENRYQSLAEFKEALDEALTKPRELIEENKKKSFKFGIPMKFLRKR